MPWSDRSLDEVVEELGEEILIDLEIVEEQSKIEFFKDGHNLSWMMDRLSKHYEPKNDEEQDDFMDLLTSELKLMQDS